MCRSETKSARNLPPEYFSLITFLFFFWCNNTMPQYYLKIQLKLEILTVFCLMQKRLDMLIFYIIDWLDMFFAYINFLFYYFLSNVQKRKIKKRNKNDFYRRWSLFPKKQECLLLLQLPEVFMQSNIKQGRKNPGQVY